MVIFRRIPNCISHLLLRIHIQPAESVFSAHTSWALFAWSVRLYQGLTDQFGDAADPVAEYDWAYEKWLYSAGFLFLNPGTLTSRYGGRSKMTVHLRTLWIRSLRHTSTSASMGPCLCALPLKLGHSLLHPEDLGPTLHYSLSFYSDKFQVKMTTRHL